jgi:hypothetical protein
VIGYIPMRGIYHEGEDPAETPARAYLSRDVAAKIAQDAADAGPSDAYPLVLEVTLPDGLVRLSEDDKSLISRLTALHPSTKTRVLQEKIK